MYTLCVPLKFNLSLLRFFNVFNSFFFSQSQSRDKTAPKGDFIFQVSNVIEVVTKTIAVVQEVEKRSVKFTVTEQ